MSRTDWVHVLDEARAIVESYDTLVTLRQLFYRLVAAQLIRNAPYCYRYLSRLTADGRRDGTFPELTDRTREIHEYQTFTSPTAAIVYTGRIYRRDRTEGQSVSIYLGVEKDGMVNQLDDWFGDLGLPIIGLRGYASQSYVDEVVAHVQAAGRPAVLAYAGDHDPTGWDILRDFVERTDCWMEVIRVALDPQLVEFYRLPEAVDNDPLTAEKLENDPRARGFVERFGKLTQVELDALPPDVLRGLYQDAIDRFWDMSQNEAVLEQEADEREQLTALADQWEERD